MKSYIVSAWSNGSVTSTGSGYGIRIRRSDFEAIKNWKEVHVGKDVIKNSGRVFTKRCPEIRSLTIGIFLKKNALDKWKANSPPQLHLCHLGSNRFELSIQACQQ